MSHADSSSERCLKATDILDNEYFQAVLNKLHDHAADTLRYEQPEPYNQQLIDTLRLQTAAYLPGASLADVCDLRLTVPKYSHKTCFVKKFNKSACISILNANL